MTAEFTCTYCHETKPIDQFRRTGRGETGYGKQCKKCVNERHKQWITPEYMRESNLKKSFGITLKDYNTLLENQKGVCAICGNPETTVRQGKVQHLSVDHCHTTGKIRGLLCNSCNRALGKFKDNLDNLKSAVKYLEYYK